MLAAPFSPVAVYRHGSFSVHGACVSTPDRTELRCVSLTPFCIVNPDWCRFHTSTGDAIVCTSEKQYCSHRATFFRRARVGTGAAPRARRYPPTSCARDHEADSHESVCTRLRAAPVRHGPQIPHSTARVCRRGPPHCALLVSVATAWQLRSCRVQHPGHPLRACVRRRRSPRTAA